MDLRFVACIAFLTFLIPATVAAHGNSTQGEVLPPSSDYVITSVNFDYLVHIDDDESSPHYYPILKGLVDSTALDRPGPFQVGNPQGYHHGYSLLGFAQSYFGGGDRNVYYWDCSEGEDFDCNNGYATSASVHMPVTLYATASSSCTRMVLGHELFHKVQSAYKAAGAPSFPTWVKEGQARAMQDKIYTDLDTDPSASCVAEYNDQVDSYLGNPDVSIWNASYSAALFWTYLMEQFGTNDEEPTLGADFVAGWWFASILPGSPTGSVELTDEVIAAFDDEQDTLSAFRSFAIANLVKDFDLSNASANFVDRYTYRDEDPIGPLDQDFYAPVEVSAPLVLTDLQNERTRNMAVNDHGAEYHQFDVSQCSAGRTLKLSFEPEPLWQGYPLNTLGAWAAEFTRGSPPRPAYHYRIVENDWSVSVLQTNPPIEDVYAITSGVGDAVLGTVRMQCLNTVYTPRFPVNDTFTPVLPGPGNAPGFGGGVQVAVADIGGDNLDPRVPRFRVGSQPAEVVAAVPDGGGHNVRLRFPTVPTDGVYPLEVSLGSVVATTPARYGTPQGTVVFLVDNSVAMAQPAGGSRLQATRDALNFLIDSLGDDVRVGLITHAADSIEPNNDAVLRVSPALLTAAHRTNLRNALAAMTTDPNRPLAAYGDAAAAAAALPPPTGSAPTATDWVFVALAGPGPGEPPQASIIATARGAGARVHTVSLGPTAPQAMLSTLASRTGGTYHGTAIASVTDILLLELAAFEVANAIESRQIVFEMDVPVGTPGTHTIPIPAEALGLLLPEVRNLVFSATWTGATTANGMTLTLVGGDEPRRRDGPRHVTVHEREPNTPIIFQALVTNEQVTRPPDTLRIRIAGQTPRGARLLTGVSPGPGATQYEPHFVFHQIQLAAAAFDDDGVLDVQRMRFYLTAPDGRRIGLRAQPTLPPAADDSRTDDLIGWNWSAVFARPVTFTVPVSGVEDGNYQLTTIAHVARGSANGRLISRRSFLVAPPPGGSPDGDGDGLPDVVESAHACLDPAVPEPTTSDDDGDAALTFTEFQRGTDPCDPDSDDGGEQDGSEILANADPLDADDDAIERVPFAIVDMSPPDHVEEGGINFLQHKIIGGVHSTHDVMEVRGAPVGETEKLLATVVLQPGQGDLEYVHDDLVAGQEFCYRVVARTTAGRRAAPSPFACAIARNDSTVPWGSIVLHRGSPRTDDGFSRAYLGLYNEDPATTQMQFEIDGVAGRLFEPFATPVPIPYPTLAADRRMAVAVRFRDADGNVSPWYRDGIRVHPPGSLGEIRGRVLAAPAMAKGMQPMQGVWVELVGRPTEKGAISAADGTFVLTDLLPGDYVVRVAHPGSNPVDSDPIALGAGDVMQLGDIPMTGADPLFVDGFE